MSLALALLLSVAQQAGEPETARPAEPVNVEAATENPEGEVICRRQVIPSERVGQRHQTRRICRTREEWADSRSRRR